MTQEIITIGPFDPAENEEILTSVHARYFTSRDSAVKRQSYVQWLLSNPIGKNIFLAAYVNGSFASFLGFMPRRVVGFGQDYLGALAFGAMTLPEFGGRGLYRQLAKAGWDEAHRLSFDFAMGYTTRQYVLDMELRMGWSDMGASPVLALPLDIPAVVRAAVPFASAAALLATPLSWIAASRARRKIGRIDSSGYEIVSATSFAADYDELTDALRSAPTLTFAKDSVTLNWLYLSPENPFDYDIVEARKAGKLVGFAAGRRMDLMGLDGYGIMDIVTRPGDEAALAPLAAHLVAIALDTNSQAVGTMASPDSPAARALRKVGFLDSGRSFTYIFRKTSNQLPGHLLAPENWSNFWGNNDTV